MGDTLALGASILFSQKLGIVLYTVQGTRGYVNSAKSNCYHLVAQEAPKNYASD
jgi:hypothetical protein